MPASNVMLEKPRIHTLLQTATSITLPLRKPLMFFNQPSNVVSHVVGRSKRYFSLSLLITVDFIFKLTITCPIISRFTEYYKMNGEMYTDDGRSNREENDVLPDHRLSSNGRSAHGMYTR